ncbi:MAG: hypothetical protein LBI48_09280 [Burkholderiaceae bacterium]|nr:hypothetical protein [Burkholderiaceae bacterium]
MAQLLLDNKVRAIPPSEGLTEAHMRQFTAASLLVRASIVSQKAACLFLAFIDFHSRIPS